MILYVNACVRAESRTNKLAHRLISRSMDNVKEIKLSEKKLPEVDADFISWRNEKCEQGVYTDPVFDLARDFATADTIVIAAPYRDL